MENTKISPRAQVLLKHLVELYIRDGLPIGSKTLVEEAITNLSAATVRKVLGDLEELGYLASPHTSAGRIPTVQGLRFFVDSLLTVYPLEETNILQFKEKLDPAKPTDDLILTASTALSELTRMVGIVTLPHREKLILRHVEFLPLSDNRILAILVVNEREVQNRIIPVDKNYTASELSQVSNFLNQHFSGKSLHSVRNELLHSLHKDKLKMDHLMQTVLDIASRALVPQQAQKDYVLAGQQNLLCNTSHVTMGDLQKLFQAFTEKQDILHILDQCLQTPGVQMYIGEESGYEALSEYSMVTSRYSVDGKLVGVLGVIGPKRMAYDKVIPIVDLTAKLLGTALDQEH